MSRTLEPPVPTTSGPEGGGPRRTAGAVKKVRRFRRKPTRRFFIVTHRWLSLILGLVLLAITVSGSILLYRPDIVRALNDDAYDSSGKPATVSLIQAREIVAEAHPKFESTAVIAEHGIYNVTDYEESWTVDPADGKILGHLGEQPWFFRFMDNVHECALSCEGSPGTITALTKEVPGTAWLGHEGAEVTGGSLLLIVLGALLLYLTLTGVWLWFPRPKTWPKGLKASVTIRWKRGRFARDTDLHKVAGMIAVPLLGIWAITGLGYETELAEKAWYAATPGKHVETLDPVSKESERPDVTPAQATAAAQRLHPDLTLVSIDVPAKDDPTAAYYFYFARGFDAYWNGEYPGNLGTFVDRHTGVAKDFFGFEGTNTSQILWDEWNFPVHTGYIVNGWWRVIWLVLGLSPLLLAITGVSTWLFRRRTKKIRAAARKAHVAPPALPQDVVEELVEDPEQDPALAEDLARSESGSEPDSVRS